MSIQTELTRIKNAKAAIKTAIEGKGVTVPDGTLLDGMASLIESIEAGGGSAKVAFGTFTLSETKNDTGTFEVEHGLGVVPDIVLVSLCGVQYSSKTYELDTILGVRSGARSTFADISAQKDVAKKNSTSGNNSAYYFNALNLTNGLGIDTKKTTAFINNADSSKFLLSTNLDRIYYSGRTYLWLAVGGIA